MSSGGAAPAVRAAAAGRWCPPLVAPRRPPAWQVRPGSGSPRICAPSFSSRARLAAHGVPARAPPSGAWLWAR
eukprot:315535-Prymnesium_polylepis.1